MTELQEAPRQCPVCGLFSPDIALRCDCGWDFAARRVETPYRKSADPEHAARLGMTLGEVGTRNIRRGWRLIVAGLGALVAFVVFSLATESAAPPWLFYTVYLFGANVLGGAALVIRGGRQLKAREGSERSARSGPRATP